LKYENTAVKYNWGKADFEAMAQCFQRVDWNAFLCYNPSALLAWYAFVTFLHNTIDVFVPKCMGNNRKTLCKQYPREIRNLRNKKLLLWKKSKSKPTSISIRWQYRECADKLREKCGDLIKRQEERIVKANNLGLFYKHINNRIKHRSSIGALIDKSGDVVTSDEIKATMFNEYYATVGAVDDGNVPYCTPSTSECVLESINFTEADIVFAINRFKPNLSSGSDNLPPILFKRLKYCFARPLAMLFNQLLSVAAVPPEWKEAIIVPVFKKGTSGDVSNYRPISLTCVPGKIMEKIISQRIYGHLVECNLLCDTQHGFVKRRSTCSNLLEAVNDWTLVLQNKRSVTIAYIDFARAFDSVSHPKLFARLGAYGIRGNLLNWLMNFLSDRTHKTRVGQYLSALVKLLSGTVQGSGIGPILFLIYIDGLAKLLKNHGYTAKFFADDVKVYVDIIDVDDIGRLQVALDLIADWASVWQLQVSVNKCSILHIGPAYPDAKYFLNGCELPYSLQCKDLGVTISHDLSPACHISEITGKAHRRANCILRCFVSKDVDLLVRAFLVYVRPLLEYCSVVWSPSLKQDIEAVEKVQRKFTKRLKGFGGMSYKERLVGLGLPSLELRRLQLDLLCCYKILFGLVDMDSSNFFKLTPVLKTRGHAYKLFKAHCPASVRSRFFADRVINVWNALPQETNFSSLAVFRQCIEKNDFSEFLKCN